MSLAKQLELLVPAGRVERYHNTPMLRRQTVGEHTWLVTWLALELCADLQNPAEVLLVLSAALLHDAPEAATGDLPAPAKRALGSAGQEALDEFERNILGRHGLYQHLHPAHQRIIKIADVLEGYLNCSVELYMGNSFAAAVRTKFSEYIDTLTPFTSLEQQVIGEVRRFLPHYYEV